MRARRFRRMQPYCEGPMTTAMRRWETRATRGAFMSGLALLLVTLGVLAMTDTPIAAQSLKRGPVLIETHHTDLAGNIRLSTNEAGDVTQRLDYAPFGEVDGRSCTGDGDPTRSPQFQGKLRDPRTCLDDFGARDYYMVTGRFQSVDPVLPIETALRDPQQWNRYAYARNNPLIYTDPDGRAIDTIYDVISLGLSLRAVWRDPSSKANWASLAVDAASVAIPGMPATGTLIRATNAADNVVDAARVVDDVADGARVGGDVKLFRRGPHDSKETLSKQAAIAENSPIIGTHGVSVSTNPAPRQPGQVVRCATARDCEAAGFAVRKTGKDPDHYTVELPKPITSEIARMWNALFK